jgi:hypothetical protein
MQDEGCRLASKLFVVPLPLSQGGEMKGNGGGGVYLLIMGLFCFFFFFKVTSMYFDSDPIHIRTAPEKRSINFLFSAAKSQPHLALIVKQGFFEMSLAARGNGVEGRSLSKKSCIVREKSHCPR